MIACLRRVLCSFFLAREYLFFIGLAEVLRSCLPKKKNQKKGHLVAIAPQAQGGQRTTVFTTKGLMR
jgi:hypothetical protein